MEETVLQMEASPSQFQAAARSPPPHAAQVSTPPLLVTMVTATLNTHLPPLHEPEAAEGSFCGCTCFPETTSHENVPCFQSRKVTEKGAE